ncbi:MAG: chorismate synthase [Lachnospiraceae bacterium]|nr:chorismate synthase [Lachnospiraceae bacterium]
MGSSFGKIFNVTTFGESHGTALGVVIDGCPAGLSLSQEDIQPYLDRRKPGQSKYVTKRAESDAVEILSGTFEGVTTGTPIAMAVYNTDQHSGDYTALKDVFRPGHADFGFYAKYGHRDHRGGGRSSGRETLARVCAGAVAAKLLKEFGIEVCAYTKSIGPVVIEKHELSEAANNPFYMPDKEAAVRAMEYLEYEMGKNDSVGGIVECRITGAFAGLGDPVFDKLDANLAKAIMSIGAVKGFEIGDGFAAAEAAGSFNNDAFVMKDGRVSKETNHAGGILGGISDGDTIIFRAAFKPTPSIAREQKTVTVKGEDTALSIHGRHDPVIVPRAVVVVECMAAIVVCDALLTNATSRLSYLKNIYG